MYSVVQKNSCIFEFPAFLPPSDLGLPMHSPSALVSLNLARFLLLDPVLCGQCTRIDVLQSLSTLPSYQTGLRLRELDQNTARPLPGEWQV